MEVMLNNFTLHETIQEKDHLKLKNISFGNVHDAGITGSDKQSKLNDHHLKVSSSSGILKRFTRQDDNIS